MTRIRSHCLVLLLCLWPLAAWPHALHHHVMQVDTMTVAFHFPGDDKPWFEPYQVFAPGMDTPFQTGRINALGEVSFRADRPGAWRIRVATGDGHGTEVKVRVDEAGSIEHIGQGMSHMQRVFAALGYLLGAFGLLMSWRMWKTGTRIEKHRAHS